MMMMRKRVEVVNKSEEKEIGIIREKKGMKREVVFLSSGSVQ